MRKNIYTALNYRYLFSGNLPYILFITAILLTVTNTIQAATKVWSFTGATGAWSAPSNWAGGVAPVSGDDVTVGNTSTSTINNVPTLTLNSLTTGSSSNITLTASSSVTLTITTLNITGRNLSTNNVNLIVKGGSVASINTLTNGNSTSLTIFSGTFTINGQLSNSGTVTVNSGATLNFAGYNDFPSGITVNTGGTMLFSGSYLISGGNANVNGTLNLGGGIGSPMTDIGFLITWGPSSTLIYQGTSMQIANWYELPSSSGPANVIVNNPSGVKFSTSIPPRPVITGTLTLTSGILTLGKGYPAITFQNGNTPIVKTGGFIDPGDSTTATLTFGTSGNTGGNAFKLPDNLFTNHYAIYEFDVQRTNALTLNNQDLTVTSFCHLNQGRVKLGTGKLTVNASSIATTGTFGTSTMFVTASSTGLLAHTFDPTSGSTTSFTYPIGDTAGTASYNGFAFNLHFNSDPRIIGFKVVDDICNVHLSGATSYLTRYYTTSVLPTTGNYSYSVMLPYVATLSSTCAGGGGDIVGQESNMYAAYFNGSWFNCGTVVTPNLVINHVDESTAPLGYDITGTNNGSGTVGIAGKTTEDLRIYPNPAEKELTIHSQSIRQVDIYNAVGKKIYSKVEKKDQQSEITVDISSFAGGMYYIEIYTTNSILLHKFIKE